MSVELLKEANPVPPEQTAGSVHEERARRLLATILAEEPSRSFAERLLELVSPRLVRTVTIVGALALLALVFSVTLPFGGGSGGGGGKVKLTLLERAAAAVPDNGPITHVVWRQPDFSSESSKMTLRYEEWLDRSSGIDHVIIKKGRRVLDIWSGPGRKGHVVKNTLLAKNSGAYYLGGIAGSQIVSLMGEYRKALETKKVVLIGRGRAFGKPVFWVRFRCSNDFGPDQALCWERVGLDRHTLLPVAEEMHGFKQVQQWNRDHTQWFWTTSDTPMYRHILKVELISREQAHFQPPAME
jgi:hypothetical protein